MNVVCLSRSEVNRVCRAQFDSVRKMNFHVQALLMPAPRFHGGKLGEHDEFSDLALTRGADQIDTGSAVGPICVSTFF